MSPRTARSPEDGGGRVTHVIGALVAGGAERFVVSLLLALQARGTPVELAVLSSRGDMVGEAMTESLRQGSVRVSIGPTEKVGPRTVAWYARLLRARRADVFHLHTPNTELVHRLAAIPGGFRGAIFRTVHSTAPISAPMHRWAIRNNEARCSIACGAAVSTAMKASFPPPFIAINNGVAFRFPVRTASSSAQAKRKLNLDPGETQFLTVGRLSGETLNSAPKALDVLLASWRRGELTKRGGRLHLLGDGSLRPKLERLAEGEGGIVFHGATSEVETWFQAADIFVMPSRYEGLPIAGIEAVGAGLPAIFSDIAPLRELEAPSAVFVPVNDPVALAAAMQGALAGSPRIDPQAVASFRERYSIERTAERYCEVYATYASDFINRSDGRARERL